MAMKIGYTLDSQETVVRQVYRHWIELLSIAAVAAALFAAAVGVAYMYGRFSDQVDVLVPGLVLPPGLATLVIAMLVGVGGLVLIGGVWVYRRNYVLVTNMHLIQVEQHGLFASKVDQVSLGRIQDVSGALPGLLPTMLGYGTVIVQSAGEQKQFIFTRMPDPRELADYILAQHEAFVSNHPGSDD
ncbi:MAG TPA: PH domain-containing protein [Candidatus Saccharimonas sp.]|nr:PH domain-containing protein [Candidatus Saccharimonas sp.]